MKTSVLLLALFCTIVLCSVSNTSCKKSVPDNDPPVNPPVGTVGDSTNADTISNHLRFANAVKKQGAIPKGPAGSSLKVSFEDTIYLADEVKRPIKFLHKDTTKNVSGVYIQVHSTFTGSTDATYYYDVPEIPEMEKNDTVSVILIGLDPEGLLDRNGAPLGGSIIFEVTIVPYGPGGQPLAEALKPVKISNLKTDKSGNAGGCGLVLPPGDFWKWHLSLIEEPDGSGKLNFYNDPDKVWGGGQYITGCCINGISSYNAVLNCHTDPTKASRKFFPTFFQHLESATKFFSNNTYSQFSRQIHVNPAPDETNFCGVAEGAVYAKSSNVTEEGTWQITKTSTPYKGDSLYLSLTQTNSNGVGLVSPGGFIHQLDCNVLVLVKPNNEGQDLDLVSFYTRINTSIDGWYDFL